jgi:uncharacterized protein YjiS (DUF1127 family)
METKDIGTAPLRRALPVDSGSRKKPMKTTTASAMQPSPPIEGSCGDLGEHWHQPLLPHERRHPSAPIAAAVKGLGRWLRLIARWMATAFAIWARRARSRRELAELSEAELRDIGLTRADVMGETSKPFWRD